MKIDITHSPYYPEFVRGYLIEHKNELRKYVVLIRADKTKSCTSYARYLMAESLGRRLEETEQVDHIDEDKSNDILENLQILTQKENILKNHEARCIRDHGTSYMYKHGCRCEKCTNYMKKIRNRSYSSHSKDIQERRRLRRVSKICLQTGNT